MDDYIPNYPAHECELKKKMKKMKRPSAKERLKNEFLISDKNVRGNWYLRTKGSVLLELLRHKRSKYWYIVHPFSRYRFYWECFMVTLFLFSLVFSPFRGCLLNTFMAKYNKHFGKPQTLIVNGLVIEFFLNNIFIIDSALMFVTGHYLPEAARTELNPSKLFVRHVPNFIIDVLTYMPLESWILFIWGIDVYATLNDDVHIMLQIFNMLHFIRFRTYLRYCYSYRKFKILRSIKNRFLLLILLYYLILHWTLYFVLIIPEIMNGDSLYLEIKDKSMSWIYRTNFFQNSLVEQYFLGMIRALHFIHYDSNLEWENMYSLIDYLCGIGVAVGSVLFWFFLMVYITEIIVADNALTLKLIFIRKQLKKYMKWKDFPNDLKNRLNQYYLHRFQAHYFNDQERLERLTRSLRKEIGLYISNKLFYGSEVFKIVPENAMARLVLKMHREFYYPNDIIIQSNTFGDCMYFISSGTVSVSTVADKKISLLKDGDFFGEIALIAHNKRRTATVTAVTLTEVYRLESLDFDAFAQEFPTVYSKFEKIASERLSMIRSINTKEN